MQLKIKKTYTPHIFLYFFVLPLLSGCGFTPMYGNMGVNAIPAEAQLAQIAIGNIPDREGQYLRNLLIDRFYRDRRPESFAYRLEISDLTESRTELDITKTADSTRAQLRISLQMRLIDTAQNAVVLERPLHAITSYNILSSEFSTRVTEQNAQESALNELARQIERRLSLYFTK